MADHPAAEFLQRNDIDGRFCDHDHQRKEDDEEEKESYHKWSERSPPFIEAASCPRHNQADEGVECELEQDMDMRPVRQEVDIEQ